MRKISTHFMISGGELIPSPIISIDDNGVIHSVEKNVKDLDSYSGLEFHNGIIIPGMVNSHCHLEYSYVKGKIPSGGGLPKFISSIINIKQTDPTLDSEKIRLADIQDAIMTNEGIVAVGDHNNNDYVYDIKQNSKIYYHTFVELFDMDGMSSDEAFEWGLDRVSAHHNKGLEATVAPHATYTMSDRLLALCGGKIESDKGLKANGAMSVHFKESIEMAGNEESKRIFDAVSSNRESILFVHSIYASKDDIDKAIELYGDKLTVVVCPMSNLYIEDNIANIDYLRQKNVRIAIGTDSLSSNYELSMIAEIRCLQEKFPHIKLEEIILWATENGADALCMGDVLGKIEKGMKCGLVNISELDLENIKLTPESKATRIV